MPEKYLTVDDAAGRLGITRAGVYALARRGKLELVRSEVGTGRGGRRVFVRAKDIDKLAEGIIRAK